MISIVEEVMTITTLLSAGFSHFNSNDTENISQKFSDYWHCFGLLCTIVFHFLFSYCTHYVKSFSYLLIITILVCQSISFCLYSLVVRVCAKNVKEFKQMISRQKTSSKISSSKNLHIQKLTKNHLIIYRFFFKIRNEINLCICYIVKDDEIHHFPAKRSSQIRPQILNSSK